MDSQIKNVRGLKFLALAIVALLMVALVVASTAAVAQADDAGKSRVLSPGSHPYGMTYGQWSAVWWQWALRPPFSQSALTDETGARCGVGQLGPVWFLAGVANSSGVVTRNCAMPADKALFIPILNAEWDNAGYDTPQSEATLRAIAAGVIDHTDQLTMSIDGKEVQNLTAYRTKSPVFFYTMPAEDNVYGLKCSGTLHPTCKDGAGNTVSFAGLICTGGPKSQCLAYPVVGDGYYVMLSPLPVGEHTIHFGGRFVDYGFTLDITYHLTVGP